jgi:O-succinylbenzoate synthase
MTSADSINSPSAFQEVFQDFIVVAIPTKTNFRGITIREVALFRGTAGWSEFSPFLEYEKAEAKVWLKAAIEGAYVPWPIALRDSVQINATLPQIDVARVSEILSLFPGCTTIKIKVSDFVHDSEIVEAVLNEIPNAKIRLDVNGGWTLQQALANLHNYQLRFGEVFEYVEQPCSSSADLVELKQRISMKIAADESIRKALNSDLSVIKSFADIAIIKWQPSGGIQARLKVELGFPTASPLQVRFQTCRLHVD